MNEPQNQTLLSERLSKAIEVADVLNISRALAYRLIRTREIPTVCIGTTRRVRPADLENCVEVNLSHH